MGTSTENFCLRWNDFESNVSGAFRDLRADSDFFDVTLGCADGHSSKALQAHKVILSACSSTFKQMLRDQARSSAHPHPYIFLRGVSFCDLSAVLDFMYHGEVNVAQEDLNSFLAVAEELQIKGLTQKEGGEPSKKTPSQAPRPKPPTTQPAVKRPRQESPAPGGSHHSPAPGGSHHSQRSQDVSEVKPVDIKSDPEAGPSGSQAVNQGASAHAQQGGSEGYADDTGDFEDYGDYYGDDNGDGSGAGGADGSMMGEGGEDSAGGKDETKLGDWITTVKWGKGWLQTCKACGYRSKGKTKVTRHFELKHLPNIPATCHICKKVYKNATSRDEHCQKYHGITKEMIRASLQAPTANKEEMLDPIVVDPNDFCKQESEI